VKYGKIRIEDGNLIFTKHMRVNSLPCKDILWAYMRREGLEGGVQKQLIANSLIIVTRRRKRYQFEMTEREVTDCLQLLKALNPDMATGFPRGARIPLRSLQNTRDLGALMATDGRHILPRKLIRSGTLYHMSLADQDTLLEEYHLSKVIDLRTRNEQLEKPDPVMSGVHYRNLPIFEEDTFGLSRNMDLMEVAMKFPDDPDQFMKKQYESLILDQFSVKQYARFLDMILRQEEGAVLWHCSMGKDRAGVATALLLCALGIPREVIREDFVKTNQYLHGELEYMIRYLESRTIVDNRLMDAVQILFTVKKEYLDAVFQLIEKKYGSVEHFLRKALYLTPKAMEDLRNKYLV
jgi:protein-tyrosine phosphatase